MLKAGATERALLWALLSRAPAGAAGRQLPAHQQTTELPQSHHTACRHLMALGHHKPKWEPEKSFTTGKQGWRERDGVEHWRPATASQSTAQALSPWPDHLRMPALVHCHLWTQQKSWGHLKSEGRARLAAAAEPCMLAWGSQLVPGHVEMPFSGGVDPAGTDVKHTAAGDGVPGCASGASVVHTHTWACSQA